MNLLGEISFGKTYADFISSKNSPGKSSKMSDRRSPVPPVPQISRTTPQVEPTRDYDIIDDEAVVNTAPGVTSGPGGGGLGKVFGQVGHSLHASAEKIFRKSSPCGSEAGDLEEAGEALSTRLSDRDADDLITRFPRNPGEIGEGEIQCDQHRSHGNEMEFRSGTVMQPESDMPTLNLPHVNCPEKIIICIDLATEVNRIPFVSKDGSKYSPLEMVKKALNMFVQVKSTINSKHEFALVLLQESALWIQDFTSDVDEFVNVLFDMTNDTRECESCDLTSLFDVIREKVVVPEIEDVECLPPPYIIRTMFVYGRSRCIPQLGENLGECFESQRTLSSSPYFFFDVFYVHEPPTEENFCKEIYDVFLNLDVHNTSYIHEVGRETAKLHEKMAMLVAHPLQRPPQIHCQYNIFRDE